MSYRRMIMLICFLAACISLSCSPTSPLGSCPPDPEEIDEKQDKSGIPPPAPVLSSKELGPNERRYNLIILPSDIAVEINGVPARRRDGVVEYRGKADDELRIRVSRGSWSEVQTLTLASDSAPLRELKFSPPASVPLNKNPLGTRKIPDNPLIPDEPILAPAPDDPFKHRNF